MWRRIRTHSSPVLRNTNESDLRRSFLPSYFAISRLIFLFVWGLSLYFLSTESHRQLYLTSSQLNYSPQSNPNQTHSYKPAPIEKSILQDAQSLGYDKIGLPAPSGCEIWKDEKLKYHGPLHALKEEVKEYNKRINNFHPSTMEDLRDRLRRGEPKNGVCDGTKIHPNGLNGIFTSGQISLSRSGYIEPLTPPMRHPGICWNFMGFIGDLSFLVHDFQSMCRNLKPHSKIVFMDLGASLKRGQGPLELMDLFEKFGFHFDHIYAFEITKQEPSDVFEMLPARYLPAYHWINVGISSDVDSPMNPFQTILRRFQADDLILVKLDIDTPSIEIPLAKQLLEDETLSKLVDQFYFEHHVFLAELARPWGRTMDGTVKESLELFYRLRQRGVPAHFWT